MFKKVIDKLNPFGDSWKITKNTIKCLCGYDTGLNQDGFLYCPPPEGLKCPECGAVILKGSNYWC